MLNQSNKKPRQRLFHEISSFDTLPPSSNYRRIMSNPLTKLVNAKQENYEMKLTRSFPTEILHRSKDLRKPYDMDDRLPKILLKALSNADNIDSDGQSSSQSKTISKTQMMAAQNLKKSLKNQPRRKVKRLNSVETPSIIKSDSSVQDLIRPIDEYPLYRIINDAVGDLAGLMSASVLKKTIINQERYLDLPETKSESIAEDSSVSNSQDAEIFSSQAHLQSKSLNLFNKPIPTKISGFLKRRCSLWRLQNKNRVSINSSLSVNPSSEKKEESALENKVNNEDDDTQVQSQPSNNVLLIKKLMEECTPHNIIYRNIRKCMFPYRINPKDFPDIHTADINNSRHFLQTLIGHDKVFLNMRPSMVKIHQFLVHKHSNEVEIRQKKLEEKETKRLRKLQVQGIVHQNYDETESATDNFKLAEKPHITYNSLKPIFNENPYAMSYKCMVRQFDRELILKEKEEDDVASIGDVSFVSSTSSYENNLPNDLEIGNIMNYTMLSQSSFRDSNSPTNQCCVKYMMPLNILLSQLEKENKLSTIYQTSEPLMCNASIKADNQTFIKK